MRNHNRPHRNSGRPCGTEKEHDGGLSDLLNRCGHYYTHRIGGRHRGQNSVLIFLAEHPDVTQKELSEEMGITPASLSEVLMKLERKGHIERFKDETDRRFIRVRLTEAGTATLSSFNEESEDPFVALSKEEQETLKDLLSKLLNDWETRCAADRNRRGCRHKEDRDFSHHGNEYPGHNDEHPEHRRDPHADHSEREHSRDAGRRGHSPH